MSPEFLSSAKASVDVWSFGVVLSKLFVGNQWEERIKQSNHDMQDQDAFNENKRDVFPNLGEENHIDYIIDQCLQYDESKRPTMDQVVKMLKIYEFMP